MRGRSGGRPGLGLLTTLAFWTARCLCWLARITVIEDFNAGQVSSGVSLGGAFSTNKRPLQSKNLFLIRFGHHCFVSERPFSENFVSARPFSENLFFKPGPGVDRRVLSRSSRWLWQCLRFCTARLPLGARARVRLHGPVPWAVTRGVLCVRVRAGERKQVKIMRCFSRVLPKANEFLITPRKVWYDVLEIRNEN